MALNLLSHFRLVTIEQCHILNIPATSPKQFKALECEVKTNLEKENILTSHFKAISDLSLQKYLSGCLKDIITDEAASTFSWHGQHGTIAVKGYYIMELIKEETYWSIRPTNEVIISFCEDCIKVDIGKSCLPSCVLYKMATNHRGTYGDVIYIPESVIVELLTWPMLFEALKQAFLCVVGNSCLNLPVSVQPPRSFTSLPEGSGLMLAMPGYVGNFKSFSNLKPTVNTLACKLVTSFSNNANLQQPLPNILGTIFLFDTLTGRLKSIIEATTITERRTAVASVVATKYLYFNRQSNQTNKTIAIIGCGVQGRNHAIAMLVHFHFDKLKLWNRTKQRAIELEANLKETIRSLSKNEHVNISVVDTVGECVRDADVIVVATNTSIPLIEQHMLINDCHINAVGAGQYHYNELSSELYRKCSTYIDYSAGANVELKGLETNIIGQVGEVIAEILPTPELGITVFQSLGMAVEDATIAQYVYDEFLLRKQS